MAGKDKIIELLARCLEDLLCCSSTFSAPFRPRSKMCIQDYINLYLLRRVNDTVQQRIYSDQVLYTILSQDPRENPDSPQITAWDGRAYFLSTQFRNIGEKYITNWEKMNAYLLGTDTQWWTHLSKKWLEGIGQGVFNSEIHIQRQSDRENWESTHRDLPLNEDIQYEILAYL